MNIGAKDIIILVARILKLSTNVCCRFLQNHPFVSIVLLFLFVLYFFLPKLFIFLLYSSPFLACTAVFIRFYFHSKTQDDVRLEKKDHAITSTKSNPQTADLFFIGNDKSNLQSRALSDRNVKDYKILESQALVAENSMVSSAFPNGDEVKPREVIEKDHVNGLSRNVSIGENIAALGEASSLASFDGLEEQAAKCDGAGEAESENSSTEEDDEEEERQAGRSKALEWTEDDQQNLMDLGISELERNKRLESLIARRKVRKLFKMQTEKILINVNGGSPIPIAPVLVSRGNPFDIPDNPDEQIPGSAPSILLPTQNPFDLPYDPFEEKPNLMADSFQQEFTATQQKDMLFCRHESFTWGPSFSLEGKHREYGIAGNNRLRRQQDKGNHDWLEEYLLPQNGEPLRRSVSVTDLVTEGEESSNQVREQSDEDGEADDSEMETEGKKTDNAQGMDSSIELGSKTNMRTDAANHNKNESSSSILAEDKRKITKPSKLEVLPPVFRFPDMGNSPSPNSAFCPIPRSKTVNELSYEASPATIDRSRLENHLLYTNNRPWHTPTNSVASDMQVEVSEIGSPPLTGDGSASSNDGDSLTYDGDIETEITSGSEEMWGASPYAPEVQEHELAFREINEVTREDIKGCFSGFHRELQGPVTSPSAIEMPQEGHTHSIDSVHKIFNDVEQVVEEAVQPEKSTDGTYKPDDGYLHKSQGSLHPPHKSAEELNVSYNLDVAISVEDRKGEAGKSITSQVRDITKPDEEINSESSKQSDRNSLSTPELSAEELDVARSMGDPVIHMNIGAVEKSIKQEIEHLSKPDAENDSDKPPANQPINESSMQTTEDKNFHEGKDDSILSQDGKEERITTEVQVSGVNQSSNNPSTSGIQPEMTVEEISTASTSSSSPKSVLPDAIPLDQTLSDLNQHMHIAVSESDVDRTVRNKMLNEQVLEDLAHSGPQNEHRVTNHPSIDSNFENFEETSISNESAIGLSKSAEELKNPPREFTQDANGNSGSKDLTEHSTAGNPPEPAVEVDHVNMPVTVGGGEVNAVLQNSTSIKDAVANDKESKENPQLVTVRNMTENEGNPISVEDVKNGSQYRTGEGTEMDK